MSDTPFFDKLLAEYDANQQKAILNTLSTPFMQSVKPELPRRTLAHFIKLPEPDPSVVEQIQAFITKAPQLALQGTRAGAVLSSFKDALTGPEIVDEAIRFQETGKLDETMPIRVVEPTGIIPVEKDVEIVNAEHETTDHIPANLAAAQLEFYKGVVSTAEAVDQHIPPVTYEDLVKLSDKYEGVVLTRIVSMEEIIEGITSADIIEELGTEFAKKYPNSTVSEVNVGEDFFGRMIIKVRGTLIHEESVPEQTDESVNAASNDENDDEENVFVAPAFWKIRDEE